MPLFSFTYRHPHTKQLCTVDSGQATQTLAFIDIVTYMRQLGLRKYAPMTALQLNDETIRTVRSSHGELSISPRGDVTDRRLENHEPDGGGHLAAIVRFDLGEWLRHWGEPLPASFDILDLGYWHADPTEGDCSYAPADMKWRMEIALMLQGRSGKGGPA
jgi:hypothetical protein